MKAKDKRYRHEFLVFVPEGKTYRKEVIECTMKEAEERYEKSLKGTDEAEKARACALLNDLRTQAKMPVPVC